MLVLVTFRPEFAPPWAGHGHVTALSLSRLGRRQGAAMVERVTGGKALPAEVLDQILARTDGVPLFVEELTKAVLESGLLRGRGRPLRAGRAAAAAGDPVDAAGLADGPARPAGPGQGGGAGRRLHRPRVLARRCSRRSRRCRTPSSSARWTSWRRRSWSSAAATPPEAAYSFKHALVQDAAYESLLKSRRQQLHARIAAVLEERFPEAAEAEPELLAHHLAEAGQAERAIVYLQRAARRALARSADLEAVEHLRAALGQLDRVGGTERREVLEFELQAALGRALSTCAASRRPRPIAPSRGRRSSASGCRSASGCSRCCGAASSPSTSPASSWPATGRRGSSLRLARRSGDTGHRLTGERILGDSAWAFGRLASARRHLERALALYDPAEHAGSRWTTPTTSGWWRGTC